MNKPGGLSTTGQLTGHGPIETIYGTACRTCVSWQDAPLAEGGETEFGIAIPAPWPCAASQHIGELEQQLAGILADPDRILTAPGFEQRLRHLIRREPGLLENWARRQARKRGQRLSEYLGIRL